MKDINYLKENGVNPDTLIEELGIETYNEVMETFSNEILEKANKLVESFNSNNLADYATYAHAIKGEANYLGFTNLLNLSYEHQKRAQSGDIEYIRNNINDYINEINRTIKIAYIYLGKS